MPATTKKNPAGQGGVCIGTVGGTNMPIIAETTQADKVIAANLRVAISNADSESAWEAIEAFDSPARARRVLSAEVSAYISELAGVARALNMSASDFFEGVY